MARAQRGYELRVSGWTWQAISDELGYSSAHNCAKSVRKFSAGLPDVDVDELRRGSVARTMIYAAKAMENVQAGRPGSLSEAIKVEQRLCALLGLDAGQRVELTHNVGDDFMEQLYARIGPPRMPVLDVIEV